jgi:glycosyltransferase involved in cell wall biosynthesis
MKPKISIVAPAFNEEKLLTVFLNGCVSELDKLKNSYEIIIVENGSQDKTFQIAKDFSRNNHNIKVFHLPKPAFGPALIKGMNIAKGDYLVVFNVDFWDKKFLNLKKLNFNKFDIYVGSKTLPESLDKRPLTRRITTFGLYLALKFIFKYQGTDTHGIKIFNRSKIIPILKKCKLKSGIFDSELLIRAQRGGLRIADIPVIIREHRPNRFGIKRILETPSDLLALYKALK